MSDESKRRRTIDKNTASRITLWMADHVVEFHEKIDRVMLVDRVQEAFNVEICAERAVSMAKVCQIKLRSKPREAKIKPEPILDDPQVPELAAVLEQILQEAEHKAGFKRGEWGRRNGSRKLLKRIASSLAVPPAVDAKPGKPVKVAAKQAAADEFDDFDDDFDDFEEPRPNATKAR
jgi:hypothetical protein